MRLCHSIQSYVIKVIHLKSVSYSICCLELLKQVEVSKADAISGPQIRVCHLFILLLDIFKFRLDIWRDCRWEEACFWYIFLRCFYEA